MVRIVPKSIRGGVSFRARAVLSRYPPSQWDAVLILRGASKLDIPGTVEADAFLFEAETAGWKPGVYAYCVRVSRDGEIQDVESGSVNVLPDLANVEAGHDARGHVRKVLDAIEAVIEGRATSEQASYRMGSLEISKMSHEQLLLLRDRYRQELAASERAESGAFFTKRARVWL